MNIYDFINSKSIKEYLKKTEYNFNSLEATYIVWQSQKHSKKERYCAWEWIIHNMNDYELTNLSKGLFEALKQYMTIDKKLTEKKISPSYARERLGADDNAIYSMFNSMWINIPTPFTKGDIVSHSDGIPIVLIQKCGRERTINKFECENGQTWYDMIPHGYIFDKRKNAVQYVVAEESYLSLDYYEGQLQDGSKILLLLSNYYKNHFDPAILMNTCLSLANGDIENTQNWTWIHDMINEEIEKSDIFNIFPICKQESENPPF